MADTDDIRHLRSTIEELQKRLALQEEKLQEQSQIISKHQETEDTLRKSEEAYRSLFKNMLNGFAYCRMLYKDGKPDDFIYLSINDAVEPLMGTKDIVGKRVTELVPRVKETDPELLEIFGRVVMTGQPERFEKYVVALQEWFSVCVYSPEKDHFALVFDVITNRKREEKDLQAALTKYKTLFDSFPHGITVSDSSGQILEANHMAEKLLGLSQNEHVERQIDGEEWQIIRPDGSPMPAEEYASVRALKEKCLITNVEMGIVKSPNETTWISVTASPLDLPGYGVVITYGDISERKRTQEELRRNEMRLHLALESAKAGTWEWNLRTNENIWSEELWKIYGIEPHSCKPSYETWLASVHPDDRAETERKVQEAVKTRNELNIEWRVIDRDGAVRWLMSRGGLASDLSGEVERFIGVVIDITERKQAEQALQGTEGKLRLFIEQAPVAIAMFDQDMRYISASRRWRSTYNLGNDIIGYSHYEVFPDIPERWKEAHRRGLSGQIIRNNEDRFDREDGSIQWVRWELRPWYTALNEIGGIVLFGEDITERKIAEDILHETTLMLETTVKAGRIGLWNVDLKTNKAFYSPEWKQQLGYKDDEIGNDIAEWKNRIHPDDLKRIMDINEEFMASNEPAYESEFRLRHKDGTYRWILSRATVLRDESGHITRRLGSHIDITGRKHAEEELAKQKSAEQFRSLIEGAPDAIIVQTDEIISYMNAAACRLFGVASADHLVGQPILDRVHPSLRASVKERIRIANKEKRKPDCPSEQIYLRMDGSEVPVEVSAEPIVYEGKNGAIIFFRDIFRRKEVEEALRKSEEQFRSLVEGAPYGIVVRTGECISYLNYPACHLFGAQSPGQLLGKPVIDYVHPAMRDIIKERMHRVDNERQPAPAIEMLGAQLDGSEIWVEASSTPIVYEDQNGAIIFLHDITERKRAEEKLRQSEALFQSIVKASPDIITITDLNGHLRMISKSALTMLGYNNYQNVPSHIITDFLVPEDRERAKINMVRRLEGTLTGPSEYKGIRADGSVFDVEANVEVIRDATGQPTGMVIITRDISERKRAEQALRDSESQFRSLIEGAPDAIFVQTEGCFSYLNPAACRLWGAESPSMLLGRPTLDRVHPSIRTSVQERIRFVNEERKSASRVEHVHLRLDGSEVPVEVSAVPIVYGSKKGALVFARDISKRRQAEQALRESERNYREIFNATNEAIFLHDAVTGNILDVNDTALKMFGYETKEEILNSLPGDLSLNKQSYTGEERQRLIQLAIEQGPQVFEWHARKKNGALFWVEMSLRSTEIGGKGRVLAVAHDITERKRAEQALKESERNYREIFNATGEAIVLHDAVTGRILDMNDTAARMIGYERKTEVLAKRIADISVNNQPNIHEIILHRIRLTVEEGPQTFEWQMLKKDGSWFWAEVCLRSTRIGGEGRVLAVSRDITERKHAEKEREKLQVELAQAQKLESVGRLAGGVAHEFNNMLNVIISYAELGMYNMDPSEHLYINLKEIIAAAQRSAEVTRKLLAFARKQLISPKVIDLNKAIESTIKPLRLLIGENIQLDWQPGSQVWTVKMDPVQVDQILINLCLNSRDAIEGEGKISITTENIVIDEAYCTQHEDFVQGDFVLLTVSDNGHGMDTEILEHIFEPFFTTKDLGSGTGLGMATVYGIIKQNNGFIAVFSKPQKGTTVKAYLPRYEGIKMKTEITEQIRESQGETVLVVEDEKAILDVLAKALQHLGYRTLKAGSPSEALRQTKECGIKIDLLITDVVLPEMNGVDLAKQIHAEYPDMKILYMSGYTADIVTSKGILEENLNYIQKPFTMKDMANKVRRVLEMK